MVGAQYSVLTTTILSQLCVLGWHPLGSFMRVPVARVLCGAQSHKYTHIDKMTEKEREVIHTSHVTDSITNMHLSAMC